MTDSTTGRARPLVAVGYGPRCVPVMQLAEAAAGVCDLLWMIDTAVPGMSEMADLLNRFGPVVDLEGMNAEQAFKTLADWEPDGMTTYLDAGMVELACVAEDLGLPFHSPATAAALTDKARQRRALADAGLDVPPCHLVRPYQSSRELSAVEAEVGWPAVLKPRSAQGSRYTFLARDRAELENLLVALGPGRPNMVLEGYLPDDPARDGDPYAGYVSVESLVADGVISHLALTGRFPPAENFRETGFFIPAALDAESRSAVLDLATQAIRRPRGTDRVPAHRGQVHTRRAPHHRGQRTGGRRCARDAGAGRRSQPARPHSAGGPGRAGLRRRAGGHRPHWLPVLPPAADRLRHGDGHRGHQRLQ